MNQPIEFANALEAADHLDDESQAQLVAILSRRFAERGRQRVIENVAEARREFAEGLCKPMSAEEILCETQS